VYNAASVVITTCFSIIFAEAFVYFESVLSTDQKMSSLLFSFRAAAQQALTRRGAMAVNSPLFRRDYRQVIMEQDGKKTSIKATRVEPQYKNYVPTDNGVTCPLEARGICVTHEDVLILRQFMTSDGDVLMHSETPLSDTSYYQVSRCIKMAQREGLLPGNTDTHVNYLKQKIPRNQTHLCSKAVGNARKFKGRGPWYRRRHHMVGLAVVAANSPQVSNKPMIRHH